MSDFLENGPMTCGLQEAPFRDPGGHVSHVAHEDTRYRALGSLSVTTSMSSRNLPTHE